MEEIVTRSDVPSANLGIKELRHTIDRLVLHKKRSVPEFGARTFG